MSPVVPFRVEICTGEEPAGIDARLLERAVFLEAFGNTSELMEQEYGRYEANSVWAVVIDQATEGVAGCMRYILDGAGDLKSMADIEHPPWSMPLDQVLAESGLSELDPATTLDVATMSVAPDYRGAATAGIVSLALYQAVVQLCLAATMDHFVTILDCNVLASVQKRTGAPMQDYAGVEPASYLDSPLSMPCWCDVAEYDARLRDVEPDTHELLFGGRGFESVIALPDWQVGAELIRNATTRSILDLRDRTAAPAERSPITR